jgi:hypothetical protein
MKRVLVSVAVAMLTLPALAGGNEIRSLENLERERAQLVETIIAPQLSAAARERKLESTRRRLVDMERMVIRDDRLLGSNTPVVEAAFKHYDRTFLVHAAAEKKLLINDHWLMQVGLSTDVLMNSHKRYR